MKSPLKDPRCPGLNLTLVDRGPIRELHLTLRPPKDGKSAVMLQTLTDILRYHRATLVKLDVFGSTALYPKFLKGLDKTLGGIHWPITWVEGAGCNGSPFGGLQAIAVAGAPIETIRLYGRPVACVYSDGAARHCLVGGIIPQDLTQPPPVQARQTCHNLEATLALAGMRMPDLVRTWFFNDQILRWYGDFNRVRTSFYREKKVFSSLVPASTGVGARNPFGAALTAAAWAIQPLKSSVKVHEVGSPLQCPAPNYGSSFSRAVEYASAKHRHLFVSGTASIGPGGDSVRQGDLAGQVALTMDVIEGIVKSRRMSFADVTRCTAYFKRPEDAPALSRWCAAHRVSFAPAVVVQSDVCRDELLFELELDAIAGSGPRRRSTAIQ